MCIIVLQRRYMLPLGYTLGERKDGALLLHSDKSAFALLLERVTEQISVIYVYFKIKLINFKNGIAFIRKIEYNINKSNGGKAMEYISAKDAAQKWSISQRRVAVLCSEGRIDGAAMIGNMWIIPHNAEKPADARNNRRPKESEAKVKPFLKWAGGKGQLLSEIEKYYPFEDGKITKYAEPFVGGGAVLFDILSKYELEAVYISDINTELINAYKVIRDKVEPLIEMLSVMQNEYVPMDTDGRKAYYADKRARFNELKLNDDDGLSVEKAALMIFLNKTCFNGLYRVNKKGLFNVPMGAYKNPLICDAENLRCICELLKKVQIECRDYRQCAECVDKKTFVYIDPPYRQSEYPEIVAA